VWERSQVRFLLGTKFQKIVLAGHLGAVVI
jgi:hypothetical protein